MGRHRGEQSRWPDYLPFEPMAVPDEPRLYTAVLSRLMDREPDADYDDLSMRTERIVTSLAFLAGARESGFVQTLDAYVRDGEGYGVRVIM